MKKAVFTIKTRKGYENVSGYITADGKHGIDQRGKFWYITDIASGIGINGVGFPKRKDAEASIAELEKAITSKGIRNTDKYKKALAEMSKHMKASSTTTNTESEDKTMAKNNTQAQASATKKATPKKTAVKAKTAPKESALEKENKALRAELEILKKQIEELTRVEKTTIDTFDVEKYMGTRDNMHRITDELVEAIANTDGLTATREGKDEWLFVRGDSEEATKSRKDIFRAMSFKWSPNHNAWILAPYPIRSKKAWGAKKARTASANA